MKVLAIQLCRMGDVIQTLPLVDALLEQNQEVHLLLQDSMQDLPLARDGLRLHFLPPAAPDAATHPVEQERLLESLHRIEFDLTINLSFDERSSLIATYLEPPASRGLRIGRDRISRAFDPWTHYLLSVPEHRRQGPFNLAQAYGYLADVCLGPQHTPVLTPTRPAREVPCLTQLQRAPKQVAPRVGLVPGASDSRKRWPAVAFAELARQLIESGHALCLLGSPEEKDLGVTLVNTLSASGSPVHAVYDWIGMTDLAELCTVLSTLELVITNDTGTMHLAAALGVRTLSVTLGPAHVYESGPYGEGHMTIESDLACHPCEFSSHCADPVCGPTTPSLAVARLARHMLEEVIEPTVPALTRSVGSNGRRAELALSSDDPYRVYVSEFDESGRLTPQPVFRYSLTATELIRALYASLWEQTLHARRRAAKSPEIARALIEKWDVTRAWRLNPDLDRIQHSVNDFVSALEHSANTLLALINPSPNDAAPWTEALLDLEERIRIIGQVEEQLAPLCTFTLTQCSMAGGRQPSRALTEVLSAVSCCLDRGRLFSELLSRTREELSRLTRQPAAVAGHVRAPTQDSAVIPAGARPVARPE